MRDAVDIRSINFGIMPQVMEYNPTVEITGINLGPDKDNGGYQFITTPKTHWPNIRINGWDGDIQYTVFVGRLIGGAWSMAGVIQMWHDKIWTGAPLTSQWKDWAYDRSWVGELANLPNVAVGEEVLFMLVAGNARYGMQNQPLEKGQNIPERSNIVKIRIPQIHNGSVTFEYTDVPSIPPTPSPDPIPVPAPAPEPSPIPVSVIVQLADLKEAVNLLQYSNTAILEVLSNILTVVPAELQVIQKAMNNPFVGRTFLGPITLRRDSTKEDVIR
jgi:hypothetical protein